MIDQKKVDRLIKLIFDANQVEVMGESENVKVEWDCFATGEPENQVLLLTWSGSVPDEGLDFSLIFTEQGLSDADNPGQGVLSLMDHSGDPVQLRLWERSLMCIEW